MSTSETAAQPSLRLGVAQTTLRSDPEVAAGFVAAGTEIRSLMRRAHEEGADVLLFPEASLCFPDKHRLSSRTDRMAEADWSRFAWSSQQKELDLIAAEAARLRLWTVIGAIAPASKEGSRPSTVLHVIDDRGRWHGRYAERLLSRTKHDFLYAPGEDPVIFTVGGLRFGCASGLEVLFPEIFSDYESAGVDCVLFGTAGPGPSDRAPGSLLTPARTVAQLNGLWVAYATSRDGSEAATSGIIAPGGAWVARCAEAADPAVAVVEIAPRPDGAPRVWRREMAESYRARSAGRTPTSG